MNLKKLGAVLIGVLVMGVVVVSSASASAVTEDVKFYVGNPLANEVGGSTEALSIEGSAAENFVFEVPFAGSTLFTLKATASSCVSCKVFNGTGEASGTGQIKFENVTVVSPSLCKVNGGVVLTDVLKAEPDFMEGSANLVRFVPAEGTTFATIKLEKGTGSCTIAGSYSFTGVVFGQSVNSTGTAAADQGIKFTPAINLNAGGAIKRGAEEAKLTGSLTYSLPEQTNAKLGKLTKTTPFGTR